MLHITNLKWQFQQLFRLVTLQMILAEVAKDVVRYYLGELTDDDVNKDVESSSSTSAVRD